MRRASTDIVEMGGADALPSKAAVVPIRNIQHSYTALLDQLGWHTPGTRSLRSPQDWTCNL